jgi:hypothetical protein
MERRYASGRPLGSNSVCEGAGTVPGLGPGGRVRGVSKAWRSLHGAPFHGRSSASFGNRRGAGRKRPAPALQSPLRRFPFTHRRRGGLGPARLTAAWDQKATETKSSWLRRSRGRTSFRRWSVPGSNRRPSACKADALPTELTPPRARSLAALSATPSRGLCPSRASRHEFKNDTDPSRHGSE